MKHIALFTVAAIALAALSDAAEAKGCIKGAVVGGVAGHYAGHHGFLGAVAGCIAGRHAASRQHPAQQNPPPSTSNSNTSPKQ
jgi:outer membrane lipoprotein SlyB